MQHCKNNIGRNPLIGLLWRLSAAKRRGFQSSYANFSLTRKPQHTSSITSRREISDYRKYIKNKTLLSP